MVIRGLTLKSATAGAYTGIAHQSGTLFVENSVLDGWEDGLVSTNAERLFVKGSVFRNQAFHGVSVSASGSPIVAIDDSFFEDNGSSGLSLNAGTGRVSNSVLTGNTRGARAYGNAVYTFQRCEISSNSTVATPVRSRPAVQ